MTEDLLRLITAICSLITTLIAIAGMVMARRVVPVIDQIHAQTNSLALKAEAGAHALGVIEGRRQAEESTGTNE